MTSPSFVAVTLQVKVCVPCRQPRLVLAVCRASQRRSWPNASGNLPLASPKRYFLMHVKLDQSAWERWMREEIMALNATPAAPMTRARAGSYSGPPRIWNGLFSPLSLALCTCRCTAAPFVLIPALCPRRAFILCRACVTLALGIFFTVPLRVCVRVCVFTLSLSSLSLCLLLLSRSILLHSSSISGHGGRPCSCCSRHLSTWTHGHGLVSYIHTVSHSSERRQENTESEWSYCVNWHLVVCERLRGCFSRRGSSAD